MQKAMKTESLEEPASRLVDLLVQTACQWTDAYEFMYSENSYSTFTNCGAIIRYMFLFIVHKFSS